MCISAAVGGESEDGLFSFGGLESLRDPGCVPDSYRLPERVSNIADECSRRVQQNFDDISRLSAELAQRESWKRGEVGSGTRV